MSSRRIYDLTPQLLSVAGGHDIGTAVIANADEGRSGPKGSARGADKADELEAERNRMHRALPSGRNFH